MRHLFKMQIPGFHPILMKSALLDWMKNLHIFKKKAQGTSVHTKVCAQQL